MASSQQRLFGNTNINDLDKLAAATMKAGIDPSSLSTTTVDVGEMSAAGGGNTTYTVLVVSQPAKKSDAKRTPAGNVIPVVSRMTVMAIGLPRDGINNISSRHGVVSDDGRVAKLQATELVITGKKLPVADQVGDGNIYKEKYTYAQKMAPETPMTLTNGTLFELECVGMPPKPTHAIDGHEYSKAELNNVKAITQDAVIKVSFKFGGITIFGRNFIVKARQITQTGTRSQPSYANLALYAMACAAQNYSPKGSWPFTPVILNPSIPWETIKVVAGNGGGGGGGIQHPQLPQPQSDLLISSNSTTLDNCTNQVSQKFNDGPTLEKIRSLKASIALVPQSRAAAWTVHAITSFEQPPDILSYLQDGIKTVVQTSKIGHAPHIPDQWLKLGPDDNKLLAQKKLQPLLALRGVSDYHMFLPRDGEYTMCKIDVHMLIPDWLVYRFGISDKDFQAAIRYLMPNAVFTMFGNPMSVGFIRGTYIPGQPFRQDFYPQATYVGDTGSKIAVPDTGCLMIDNMCTLLNGTLPVSRAFVLVLFEIMSISNLVSNKTRFGMDMLGIKSSNMFVDSQHNPIPINNYLHNVPLESADDPPLVNMFEYPCEVDKDLRSAQCYILVEGICKSDDTIQKLILNAKDSVDMNIAVMRIEKIQAAAATSTGSDAATTDTGVSSAQYGEMIEHGIITSLNNLLFTLLCLKHNITNPSEVLLAVQEIITATTKEQEQAPLSKRGSAKKWKGPIPKDFYGPMPEFIATWQQDFTRDLLTLVDEMKDNPNTGKMVPFAIDRRYMKTRGIKRPVAEHYNYHMEIMADVAAYYDNLPRIHSMHDIIEKRSQKIVSSSSSVVRTNAAVSLPRDDAMEVPPPHTITDSVVQDHTTYIRVSDTNAKRRIGPDMDDSAKKQRIQNINEEILSTNRPPCVNGGGGNDLVVHMSDA